jgi:hypothetical protein
MWVFPYGEVWEVGVGYGKYFDFNWTKKFIVSMLNMF